MQPATGFDELQRQIRVAGLEVGKRQIGERLGIEWLIAQRGFQHGNGAVKVALLDIDKAQDALRAGQLGIGLQCGQRAIFRRAELLGHQKLAGLAVGRQCGFHLLRLRERR